MAYIGAAEDKDVQDEREVAQELRANVECADASKSPLHRLRHVLKKLLHRVHSG